MRHPEVHGNGERDKQTAQLPEPEWLVLAALSTLLKQENTVEKRLANITGNRSFLELGPDVLREARRERLRISTLLDAFFNPSLSRVVLDIALPCDRGKEAARILEREVLYASIVCFTTSSTLLPQIARS